jgi:perosamine synthetase
MVITADKALAERAAGFSNFGQLPLAYNFRMPELHGAVGRVRLRRLDEMNAQRIRNAAYLDRELAGLRGLKLQTPRPNTKTVYYNYVLRYYEEETGVSRARFIEAVKAEGIPLPLIYFPLYRHYTFKHRDAHGHGCPFTCPYYGAPTGQPSYAEGLCPVCEEVCDRRNIELKVHPPAGEADMADIVAAFKKVLAHLDELRL